ncbi:proline iminopeptidase-family hydrolase [Lentilactobacillus diolivorans]|uniref:Proline iminopeptidase n=2 Tax=Lentilactobacillus diolivorans TaxID=179838 RepID=A0A0R1SNU6_9LACO|nr:proline iminopeptidase-family hydrolase [Lentilactobacillus diolivorans]KRL67784.1 proline-specific peptidase [Lentilactobacillus diolivorans DSM 14421]GEP22944.1 proline iminopeptidase [Lentilactobacillus diolivorans]
MQQGSKILTLNNGFHLFTRTVGEGDVKLLCVHGGPGSNHEEFENFGEKLAKYHVQVSMYDQLGSFYSDQPDFSDPANQKYLTLDYYLSELEEVRQKLGLENFYLLGHSWGGLLAQEYALKYGQHLKGVIIMSMIDNIAEYTVHINQLRDQTFSPFEVAYMKTVEHDERFDDPKYQELVAKLYKLYVNRHPERMPRHLVETMATPVYNHFQGNNEFVMVGTLNGWDRRADIHNITNPTLLTFGDHDTMPLATAKRMNEEIPSSRLVLTPDGGHCHSVDNPKAFFKTLGGFIEDVETGNFK